MQNSVNAAAEKFGIHRKSVQEFEETRSSTYRYPESQKALKSLFVPGIVYPQA